MIYGSVCSGIESASVAWHPLGWRPAFFAEVDRFPSAVLAHRYPEVPNLGDFTTIPDTVGPIDVLVGGTPCQSFSVAGRRLGLDDPRGNLAIEFLRLARRLRPRWLVWENVPGVLSSAGGRDFGAFLGLLGELGYGWTYRVLDAQFVRVDGFRRAVPQRRRRVFVVGHLGDWRRACAVLFDRESLSGNPPPRREARQDDAAGIIKGAAIGREPASGPQYGEYLNDGTCYTLNCTEVHAAVIPVARCLANGTNPHRFDGDTENFIVAHSLTADGFDASEDGTGRGTPLVVVPTDSAIAYQCHGNNIGPMGTLRKGDGGLTSGVPFIVNAAESCAKASHARPASVARCIDSTGSFANAQGGTVIAGRSAVRRLTPTECERLMGLPDDYTLIPWKGKAAEHCPDGPRYKSIGNSMAVNAMRWIGHRIAEVDAITN